MKKQMRGWLAALVVGVIGGVAQADEAVLPEGYTRIDYIESSGGQYIKAEYTHTRNTKIVCVAKVPEIQFGTWSALFGSRNGTYSNTATAIEAVKTVKENGKVEGIFSVNGARQNTLQRGVNIVKMSDGRVKKIIVK